MLRPSAVSTHACGELPVLDSEDIFGRQRTILFTRADSRAFIMARMDEDAKDMVDTGSHGSAHRADSVATALILCSAFLMFGFNNASTAIMPEYFIHLGAGALVAGAQNSACILIAVLLRFALGPLADRIGSKPLMLVAAVGFFIPCALLPACTSIGAVFALRALQAIGLAAFHPNVARYLTEKTPDTVLASRRISWSRVISTASLLVIPALLLPLAQAQSWRCFFFLMCIMPALAAFLIALAPSDASGKEHGKSREQQAHPWRLIAALPATSDGRRLLVATAMPILLAFGYSIILTFGPLHMASVLPDMNSGLILTTAGIGGLAGSFAAGRLLPRLGARSTIGTLTITLSAGLALCAACQIGSVVLAGGIAIGFGYFGAITALVALVSTQAMPSFSGTILAAQQSSLDIGMVAGSLIAGAMLQAGIPLFAAFGLAALLIAFGTFVWYILWRGRPNDEDRIQP